LPNLWVLELNVEQGGVGVEVGVLGWGRDGVGRRREKECGVGAGSSKKGVAAKHSQAGGGEETIILFAEGR